MTTPHNNKEVVLNDSKSILIERIGGSIKIQITTVSEFQDFVVSDEVLNHANIPVKFDIKDILDRVYQRGRESMREEIFQKMRPYTIKARESERIADFTQEQFRKVLEN